MIRTATFGLTAWLAWGAAGAVAAPATPEEAQRLTTLFEGFVGHPAQGAAVTVVPHGEGYTATVDLGQVFAFTASAGLAITAGPLVAELVPQGDSRWRVTVDGYPPFGIAHGEQATSVVLDGYTFDGLFDAAIHAFATATTTNTGSTSHTSGKPGGIDVKLTDTGRSTSHAEDAGNGTVDVKSVSSARNITYLLTVPPAAVPSADLPPAAGSEAPSAVMPAPPATKVTIASIETALSLTREPVVAIEELWRFLVAHPDKAALAADQAELKTRLKALIPLSTGTSADITLSGLAVTSSLGDFGLDSMVQHYDDNGPQAGGGVVMRFAMAGLKLPQDLAPAWSAPLVPTRVEFGQSYGPVDLKPGLTMAIDAMDLTADKPLTDAQAAAILETFAGDKTLRIMPGTIVTPTITATFEGEAHLVKPLPTGTATIAATGLDKAIDAVQAAASDNPGAGQAVAMLMGAKALGKAEGPDSYSWRIVAEAGGVVTINGQPFGGTTPGARPPRKKQPRLTP